MAGGFLGFPEGELDGVELRSAGEFAGVPDAMQRTWVPHRMTYVTSGDERREPDAECPFCAVPKKTDAEGLIVARGEFAYVVMNLYPYNSGHLLVCPYRHIPTYDLANDDEVLEIAHLTQRAMRVLERVSNTAGCNIGMNQGEVAGAGVAGICISTSCRAGLVTQTSCQSLVRRSRCHSCWGTSGSCSQTPGLQTERGHGVLRLGADTKVIYVLRSAIPDNMNGILHRCRQSKEGTHV